MPRNTYFSHGTTSERRVYEDLIIEALRIYGHDVYYIPRRIVNIDGVFREDELAKFGSAFMIEMYIENVDGFEGDGDLLSKFGVEVRDSMNMIVSDRRWKELVGRFEGAGSNVTRPQEGDLIYFPMANGLFEITFVEDETPFYQLQGLPTFKLSCELFEYNNEEIDTGIAEIDLFEQDFGTRTRITLGAGSGDYDIGEDVSQIIDTLSPPTTISGEVSAFGDGYIDVTGIRSSDETNTLFQITAGDIGNIIGARSNASYAVTSIEGFNTIDDNDSDAQNVDFESIGNSFIDFSESNPFGEPNIIT